jgi:hypothetical protein
MQSREVIVRASRESQSSRWAGAGRRGIVYRTREAPRLCWARSPLCLLPCSAQVVRSKDRCEKTTEGDALRTGCRDALQSTLSFAQLPRLQSSVLAADAHYGSFCSSWSTTRVRRELDVIFLRRAQRSDFHLCQNPPCSRLCALLTGR